MLGMASFYLRAVCMNRNIWGAEGFEEISIRHSKFAGHRFVHQAAPALERFASSSPAPFMAGIKAAREAIVARKDEDREGFLRKRGFSKREADGSSKPCSTRKVDRRNQCSTSCRGSLPSPATSRTRTRDSSWKARRRSYSPACADPWNRRVVEPAFRLHGFTPISRVARAAGRRR